MRPTRELYQLPPDEAGTTRNTLCKLGGVSGEVTAAEDWAAHVDPITHQEGHSACSPLTCPNLYISLRATMTTDAINTNQTWLVD